MDDPTEARPRWKFLSLLYGFSYVLLVGGGLGALAASSYSQYGPAIWAALSGFAGFVSLQLSGYLVEVLEDIRNAVVATAERAAQPDRTAQQTLEVVQRLELLAHSDLIDRG
jgi:hypothetical protein